MARTWIRKRRRELKLNQSEFAKKAGVTPRTVQRWEAGDVIPGTENRLDIAAVLDMPIGEVDRLLAQDMNEPSLREMDQASVELRQRLGQSAAVDPSTLELLASQLDLIREVDRALGGNAARAQLQGHIETIESLRRFTIDLEQRRRLSQLSADAHSLAGWQNFDLGNVRDSWDHFEASKAAGRECGSASSLAHAIAQQAYILQELDRPDDALILVGQAQVLADGSTPALFRSWLWALRGEFEALVNNDHACRDAFDQAFSLLPSEDKDPTLPYIFLNNTHLSRWYGNALASLGDVDAIDELTNALQQLDASFNRARAGLLIDLATALNAAGERFEASRELEKGHTVANQVGSIRQMRRASKLERKISVR